MVTAATEGKNVQVAQGREDRHSDVEKSIYICPILRPEVYLVCQCVSVRCDDITQARWNARLTHATSSFSHEIGILSDMYDASYLLYRKSRKVFRHQYV